MFWTSVAVKLEERAVATSLGTGTATVETVRVGVDATVMPDATLLVSLPLVVAASLSPLWWFSLCLLRERASQ